MTTRFLMIILRCILFKFLNVSKCVIISCRVCCEHFRSGFHRVVTDARGSQALSSVAGTELLLSRLARRARSTLAVGYYATGCLSFTRSSVQSSRQRARLRPRAINALFTFSHFNVALPYSEEGVRVNETLPREKVEAEIVIVPFVIHVRAGSRSFW